MNKPLFYKGHEFGNEPKILDVNNDKITIQWGDGKPTKNTRQFNATGDAYFTSKGKRYYEKEFVNTETGADIHTLGKS